ncbi:phosphonate metabolism transcriptional regulator PhnF [Desulfotomaculum copahuensis]|uniref:phosphonate metabolism transcriptional regulator PhnF n=1 Tax=Desulfotomaculum copahuensis TaxID=1838280 RepID=UPI000AADBEDF|nr:phosphonate metabolism transcriptional regulator PhnF [Desulfotomaculum copahuensis]
MIDKESGIPYYRQLMNIIRQQIASGTLKEGQQLPPEMELGAIYRVNRHTVRQAVGELCLQGLLYKIKGRGTFVANHCPECLEYRLTPQNRFTENIRQAGKMPASRVLQAVKTAAPGAVAGILGIKPLAPVYLLEILRLVDGLPFLVATNFLPAQHLPGFLEHVVDFSSLFAIYEQFYGIKPSRVKSNFQAVLPSPKEAMVLKIPAGTPVLKVDSLLKTQDDILIQYTVTCYRGDLARITVDW